MPRGQSRVHIDNINSDDPLVPIPLRQSLLVRLGLFGHDIRTILFRAHINILLIFVPFAIVSDLLGWSSVIVFTTNFLGLIPLALLMSHSTKEVSKSVGSTAGGLLNITFGNATELIVGIVALYNDEIKLIQTTMLGSILSNLGFVLGAIFVVGGIRQSENQFNEWAAQTMSSMMFVATGSLILPTAFEFALPRGKSTTEGVLALSRGTAIVLLILYLSYIFFQLKTHQDHFNAERSDEQGDQSDAGGGSDTTPVDGHPVETHVRLVNQEPEISIGASSTMVFVVAIAISLCSDNLVGSIDGIVESSGISKTFYGLIVIPIVANAAECVTAVELTYNHKMDAAIGVTIGSSVQISLFVTPFLVILGYFTDKPMSLSTTLPITIAPHFSPPPAGDFLTLLLTVISTEYFQSFQAAIIFISVTCTEFLLVNGKSDWMKGAMLLGMYAIIALSYAV